MTTHDPTTGLDLQAVEDLIRQSLSVMKSRQITIAPHVFGVYEQHGQWHLYPDHSVCLIGAIILDKQPKRRHGQFCIFSVFEEYTGLTSRQVTSLLKGFDGNPSHPDEDPAFYALGAQFRREYGAGLLNPADASEKAS
jgi:hypothetical protein